MTLNKNLRELLERWNERVAWINSQTFLQEDSPEIKQARLSRAQKDYAYFVKTYFPHLATKPCATFHISAAQYLLRHPNARCVFEWARGHAKSTHISLLIPLWLKIQTPRRIHVMILASKSQDSAIRLLGDLQAELQYNQLFIQDFGAQVKEGNWADGEFVTADGCLFIAIGRGQSPRGIKERAHRPDYIAIDDIDDDELVRNPKRVGEVLEWCKSALLGAMAMGRGRFVMVGNRIAKDSVLARMAQSRGIHHTVVNALDSKGLPSWPENYALHEISELRAFQGERLFQKEYMNNPINEGSVFSEKNICFGSILPLPKYNTLICYTDPSFKDSSTADYKATILAGKAPDGTYHVLKAFLEKTSVSAMVGWHYDIDRWVNGRVPVLYYMESGFIQDLLLDEFRKEGNIRGHQIAIRPDTRKKPDKFARIEAMQPLFERKLIVFNEQLKNDKHMQTLIDQLLLFEKGSRAHDDGPDALEGAIWLLANRTRTADARYITHKRTSLKY